jgi:hypothetical protein
MYPDDQSRGSNDDKASVIDRERSARLREARRARGFRRAIDAIRAFGWPESTYYGHENGNRGISRDQILVYARSFLVEPDWLAYGRGEQHRNGRILIGGYVVARAEIAERRTGDPGNPVELIDDAPLPPGEFVADDWIAYRVTGDANYPIFDNLDVIYVPKQHDGPEHYLGKPCVVTLQDGRQLIRRVIQGSDANLFVLFWPSEPPLIDVAVTDVAPIVHITKAI